MKSCRSLPASDHIIDIFAPGACRKKVSPAGRLLQNRSQASNEENFSHHIWDVSDSNGPFGRMACTVVSSFLPYCEQTLRRPIENLSCYKYRAGTESPAASATARQRASIGALKTRAIVSAGAGNTKHVRFDERIEMRTMAVN